MGERQNHRRHVSNSEAIGRLCRRAGIENDDDDARNAARMPLCEEASKEKRFGLALLQK